MFCARGSHDSCVWDAACCSRRAFVAQELYTVHATVSRVKSAARFRIYGGAFNSKLIRKLKYNQLLRVRAYTQKNESAAAFMHFNHNIFVHNFFYDHTRRLNVFCRVPWWQPHLGHPVLLWKSAERHEGRHIAVAFNTAMFTSRKLLKLTDRMKAAMQKWWKKKQNILLMRWKIINQLKFYWVIGRHSFIYRTC